MTVHTGNLVYVGLRHVVVYELDANGYPSPGAVPATPYEGLEFGGEKAFELTVPDPRKFVHVGRDRALQVQYLPSLDSVEAEMRVDGSNLAVIAALSGVLDFDLGEINAIALATDAQGSEPNVGALIYQEARERDSGAICYHGYIIPATRAIYMPPGMTDSIQEARFKLAPAVRTAHLWGTSLAVGTEGATQAQMIEIASNGKPNLVAWLGDGSEDEFSLPTAKPATGTGTMTVWVDGVLTTSGVTKAITSLTFTYPPADGAIVVCLYEH